MQRLALDVLTRQSAALGGLISFDAPHDEATPVLTIEQEPGTEFLDAETGAQNPPFRLLETGIETPEIRKAPVLAGLARQN